MVCVNVYKWLCRLRQTVSCKNRAFGRLYKRIRLHTESRIPGNVTIDRWARPNRLKVIDGWMVACIFACDICLVIQCRLVFFAQNWRERFELSWTMMKAGNSKCNHVLVEPFQWITLLCCCFWVICEHVERDQLKQVGTGLKDLTGRDDLTSDWPSRFFTSVNLMSSLRTPLRFLATCLSMILRTPVGNVSTLSRYVLGWNSAFTLFWNSGVVASSLSSSTLHSTSLSFLSSPIVLPLSSKRPSQPHKAIWETYSCSVIATAKYLFRKPYLAEEECHRNVGNKRATRAPQLEGI